jgi:hypothetical protein
VNESRELRELVREVLAEVVPRDLVGTDSVGTGSERVGGEVRAYSLGGGSALPTSEAVEGVVADTGRVQSNVAATEVVVDRPELAGSGTGAEGVVLGTDADLDAFVRRLVVLFENPVYRRDVKLGRIRFRLASASASASASGSGSGLATTGGDAGLVVRIERGAVTEDRVRDAARSGARIVLGPRAVITPLARDRARTMGVSVEKEH